MKKLNIKWYHGILLFVLQMLIFIYVCTPLQLNLGMTGMALTELIILAIAVLPVLLTGNSLKEVFPIKKIMPRQVLGVFLFTISAYLINIVLAFPIQYFFPESIMNTGKAMSDFFTSIPFIFSFLIVAVMPAICEEALHRGFIQYSMRGIKSKWLLILVMGFIFGIFHLDPVRFIPTAFLGGMLCYLMIETKNLLIPMLLHFMNNTISVTVSFLASNFLPDNETPIVLETSQFLTGLGAYLVFCASVPLLFLGGSRLLHKKEYYQADNQKKAKQKTVNRVAFILTPCIFLIGIGITVSGAFLTMNRSPLISISGTFEIPEDNADFFEFGAKQEGTYFLDLNYETQGFLTDIIITDNNGEVVYQNISDTFTIHGTPLSLKKGQYTCTFIFIKEKSQLEAYLMEKGYSDILSDQNYMDAFYKVFEKSPNEYTYTYNLKIG